MNFKRLAVIILLGLGLIGAVVYFFTRTIEPDYILQLRQQQAVADKTIQRSKLSIYNDCKAYKLSQLEIDNLEIMRNDYVNYKKEKTKLKTMKAEEYCNAVLYRMSYTFTKEAFFKQEETKQIKPTIIIGTEKQRKLMKIICERGQIHGVKSPLCGNWKLFKNLLTISETKGVSFNQMIGISFTESHIGANFVGAKCKDYNNRSGIKRAKLDNGKTTTNKIPDNNGCWLYKFKSVEDYWNAFANTLKMGYYDKGCYSTECISKYYVGSDGLVKKGWSKNVNSFNF